MWLLLVILAVQANFALPCTFKEVETDFAASIKEFWNNTNKQQCFELCYDDNDCTFIKHEQKMCTIFMEGVELQTKGTDIYAFERGSVTPMCSSMNLNVDKPTTNTRALGTLTTTTTLQARPEEHWISPIQANPLSKVFGINTSYSFPYYGALPNFCEPTELCLLQIGKTTFYTIGGSGELCKGFVFSKYCENEATYPVATYVSESGSECYTVVLNRTDPNPVFPILRVLGYVLRSKFFVRSITFHA